MKKRKLLMIVNPKAGRNKSRGPLFDAAAVLSEAGYLLSIHRTTAPGDASATAEREGERYDVVIAVGGDGTLNEVASGLLKLEHPPLLGYLPQGSTNDFAACLRIPPDPPAAAEGWTRAAGTNGVFSMWRPLEPLPEHPTPQRKPPRTPWVISPTFWRA